MTARAPKRSSQILRDANLVVPYGVAPPDSYESKDGTPPSPDFVVSRGRDGSTASRYGEDRWDLTAYVPSSIRKAILFTAWCQHNPTTEQRCLIEEMKWYIFILIWLRNGPPYAISTVTSYLTLLSKLAGYAHRENINIRTILANSTIYEACIAEFGNYYADTLGLLLKCLREVGVKRSGVTACTRGLKRLLKLSKEYRSNFKQYPPIPTRILSHILSRLTSELDDFDEIADNYINLVSRCAADPFLGRAHCEQNARKRKQPQLCDGKPFSYRPGFFELLDQYGLRPYFEKKKLIKDTRGLVKGLLHIQSYAVLQIAAFSGMRRAEIEDLTFNCVKRRTIAGVSRYFIAGTTTKHASGRAKQTRWVTSQEGVRAVELAKRIARVIYGTLGIDPDKQSKKSHELPLFAAIKYLQPQHFGRTVKPNEVSRSMLSAAWKKGFMQGITMTIKEEDIRELEYIDPHRAWRSEPDFEIGVYWRLTTHQFRRSLALYASRSGLVSLPSLRRQLQHITESMSLYYARGSALAKDLMASAKHFGKEYWKTQPESEALAYVKQVLLSDEILFGGHGMNLSSSRDSSTPSSAPSKDRELILARAKRGALSYKETVLGGCAEPGECDKRALRSIVGCLSCAQAVVKISKLDHVIDAQMSLVASLDETSVEHRLEDADLQQMKKFKRKCYGNVQQDG